MHWVFDESLNLSQSMDLDTQIPTIHEYIAEKHPVSITLLGSVRYPITFLRSTLPYYSVELYPALIHCCGLLYLNSLLGYTQS